MTNLEKLTKQTPSTMKHIAWARIIFLFIIIVTLTALSFFSALSRDEGTLGDNKVLNSIADAFYVFRFPTHIFFQGYITGSNFYLGLLINSIFYTILIEVMINLFKKRKHVDNVS